MTIDSVRSYGRTAKVLHWLVFVLVAAQFIVAIAMPDIGRGTKPGTLINLHMSLGFTIVAVIASGGCGEWLIRCRWSRPTSRRGSRRSPASRTRSCMGCSSSTRSSAGPTHRRVTGTSSCSASRCRISSRRNRAFGRVAGDVHVWLAWSLLALIASMSRRRSITISFATMACCSGCCPVKFADVPRVGRARDCAESRTLVVAVVLLGSHATAHADLWAYVDEQGRSHVANHQVDARYKLFFKGDTTLDVPASVADERAQAIRSLTGTRLYETRH